MNFFEGYEFSRLMGNVLQDATTVNIIGLIISLFSIGAVSKIFEKKKLTKSLFISVIVLLMGSVLYLNYSGMYSSKTLTINGKDYVYYGAMTENIADGRGRIFDKNGCIVYIGEFLNDEKNGFGTLFEVIERDGKFQSYIRYEGYWKNGKVEGNGKSYSTDIDSLGSIVYVGNFHNDYKNGNGTYYEADGKIYEGGFVNGRKHGFGKVTWIEDGKEHILFGVFSKDEILETGSEYIDGILYSEGRYFNLVKEGTSITYYSDGNKEYQGEFLNGKRHGNGHLYYSSGELFYVGEFLNGEWNGQGIFYNKSGVIIYEGEYLNGYRYGQGIAYYESGEMMYEGEYLSGSRHGQGKEYYTNGDSYEGEFENGYRNGFGTYFFADGRKYEGEWQNNAYHGRGLFFNKYGVIIYDGTYQNNNRHGLGISYDANGNVDKNGNWENGIFVE